MEKLNVDIKEINKKAMAFWDTVPVPVKIILYHGVSVLLTRLSTDLAGVDSRSGYVEDALTVVYNILVWSGQFIAAKAAHQKT